MGRAPEPGRRRGHEARPRSLTLLLASALDYPRIPIPVRAADRSSRLPLSLFSATKAQASLDQHLDGDSVIVKIAFTGALNEVFLVFHPMGKR